MKQPLLKNVRDALQAEADRVCQLYRQPFRLTIGDVRSEEGYFKASVVVETSPKTEEPPLELVRALLATIEQNVEEEYQGLRLSISPRVRKRPSVKRRKAG